LVYRCETSATVKHLCSCLDASDTWALRRSKGYRILCVLSVVATGTTGWLFAALPSGHKRTFDTAAQYTVIVYVSTVHCRNDDVCNFEINMRHFYEFYVIGVISLWLSTAD